MSISMRKFISTHIFPRNERPDDKEYKKKENIKKFLLSLNLTSYSLPLLLRNITKLLLNNNLYDLYWD